MKLELSQQEEYIVILGLKQLINGQIMIAPGCPLHDGTLVSNAADNLLRKVRNK